MDWTDEAKCSCAMSLWQTPWPSCPPISLFKMSKRPLKTSGRHNLHYTEHSFDWQPLFDKLDGPSPAPSIRALAAAHDIPHTKICRCVWSTHTDRQETVTGAAT